jgi:zinc protease
MKNTRIFQIAGRYWYFIVGVLAVSLAYGLVFVYRKAVLQREPELPVVQRINYDRFVLPNGLEVILYPDASVPAASVNMSYHAGSRDEPRGKTGLAHLTEHLMLQLGQRQTSESDSVVDRLGAWDYNGSTDRDRTRLYMTVPKQALDAALWVESERMGYLTDKLSEEGLAQARQDVLNELRRNQSASDAGFEQVLTEAVFPPAHPYSHLPGGVPEDLETISLQDVRQWIKDYFKPNNATLVVAGDVDAATVRSRVETYFGSIAGGPRDRELVSRIPQYDALRRYLTASIPAQTLVFVWSLPGQGSPDLDHLDLARHLLEVRLTQRLVFEDRIANAVRIDLKPYQLCSLLVLRIQMNTQGTEANVMSSIKQELSDITAHEAERVELNEAKRGILVSLLFTSERVGGAVGKAEILASAATLAGDAANFNLTIERIRNASPHDVMVTAAAWISLNTATLLTHGSNTQGETVSASGSSRPMTMPSASVDETGNQSHISPQQMRLENGLTVMLVKRPGPIGAMKLVWPKAASLSIPGEQLTKATLNLLSEGGGSLSKSELQRELARLSFQFVLDDTTNYYALGLELPGQYLSEGLKVFSGIVVGARFDESQVATIRSQLEQRLNRTEPSSARLYLSTLLRLISSNNLDEARRQDCGPLKSFTAADIQKTFETQFRPGAATLIVVGDIDPASFGEEVKQLFSGWRGTSEQQNRSSNPSPSSKNEQAPIYLIDRPGTDYAVTLTGLASPDLRLGFTGGDVVISILDSRASRSLREETQISHETFAGHSGWEKGGIVYVYADARSDKVAEALRLAAQVFHSPDNDGTFCEGEFKRARAIAAKHGLQTLESTRALMGVLTASAIGAGSESQAGQNSCSDVLQVSRRMSDAALLRLVLGDSKRLVQDSSLSGQRVEILEKPCWASLY